jgi:hypothetical protein
MGLQLHAFQLIFYLAKRLNASLRHLRLQLVQPFKSSFVFYGMSPYHDLTSSDGAKAKKPDLCVLRRSIYLAQHLKWNDEMAFSAS